MTKEELEAAQKLIDEPITAETLEPLKPVFPSKPENQEIKMTEFICKHEFAKWHDGKLQCCECGDYIQPSQLPAVDPSESPRPPQPPN